MRRPGPDRAERRDVAGLAAVVHRADRRPAFQACYDELAEYLRVRTIALADGKPPAQIHFLDAVGPIVYELLPRGGTRFSQDTRTGDADEVRTSTAPLRTTWWLASDEPVVLWACFGGGTVIVVRDACPDVP